ncbi:hypothetical protein [Dactylosporangium salmoneum]|uniref:Uncharacterized protein n=1 Tax=Dactylosporangium salmoneum TaxID=53361 RepID=A0ABN3HEB1_9ACTN
MEADTQVRDQQPDCHATEDDQLRELMELDDRPPDRTGAPAPLTPLPADPFPPMSTGHPRMTSGDPAAIEAGGPTGDRAIACADHIRDGEISLEKAY